MKTATDFLPQFTVASWYTFDKAQTLEFFKDEVELRPKIGPLAMQVLISPPERGGADEPELDDNESYMDREVR